MNKKLSLLASPTVPFSGPLSLSLWNLSLLGCSAEPALSSLSPPLSMTVPSLKKILFDAAGQKGDSFSNEWGKEESGGLD